MIFFHSTVTYTNKRVNDIICNWCYMTRFSTEMHGLSANNDVPISMKITITGSNFSLWPLSYQQNDPSSVILWDLKNLWRSTGTEKSFSSTTKLKMDIQERTSVSCNNINCHDVKSYGFNTVWESLIWFQQGISQPEPREKWGWYDNARGNHICVKFIIKISTTKLGFRFNQVDMWFNP